MAVFNQRYHLFEKSTDESRIYRPRKQARSRRRGIDVGRRQLAEGIPGAAKVAPIRDRLPLDPEEFRRRSTENLDPVLVA